MLSLELEIISNSGSIPQLGRTLPHFPQKVAGSHHEAPFSQIIGENWNSNETKTKLSAKFMTNLYAKLYSLSCSVPVPLQD